MAFLPEFLHYSRNERRGIFILLILIPILAIAPKTLPWFIKKEAVDFSEFEQFLADMENPKPQKIISPTLFSFDPNTLSKDSLQLLGLSGKTAQTIINYRKKGGRFSNKAALKKIYTLPPEQYDLIEPFISIKKAAPPVYRGKTTQAPRFPFDPNTCSKQDLLTMNLPEKVVQTLINFRNKGGHFNTPQDLKKVYGLSNSLYASLAPYIQIKKQPAEIKRAVPYTPTREKKQAQLNIDINTATLEEWQQLKGIGPAYAKRIVNFREKLGGFTSVAQVGTTYHLPDSTFQKIKSFLTPSPIYRKISINQANLETLKAHPILKWKEAKAIVNYRQQHGDFHHKSDLSKIRILSAETIDNILPYLNFELQNPG